jgi:hypothetical protein
MKNLQNPNITQSMASKMNLKTFFNLLGFLTKKNIKFSQTIILKIPSLKISG